MVVHVRKRPGEAAPQLECQWLDSQNLTEEVEVQDKGTMRGVLWLRGSQRDLLGPICAAMLVAGRVACFMQAKQPKSVLCPSHSPVLQLAHLCARIGAPGCDMHACNTADPQHLDTLAAALLSRQVGHNNVGA